MKGESFFHVRYGWGKVLETIDNDLIKVKLNTNDEIRNLSLSRNLKSPDPQLFFENHSVYRKFFCKVNNLADSRYYGEFLWRQTIDKANAEKKRILRLNSNFIDTYKNINKAIKNSSLTQNTLNDPHFYIEKTGITVASPKKEPFSKINSKASDTDIPLYDFLIPVTSTKSTIPSNYCHDYSLPFDQSYKKSSKDQLLELWKSLGFEGFVHTTEFDNFIKIIKDKKLKSRYLLDSNDHAYTDRANQEIIEKTDSIIKTHCRFYFRFKTPTNYAANYRRPVILVFSQNMLQWNNVKISYGNAGSSHCQLFDSIDKAVNYDWTPIFETGYLSESKFGVEKSTHLRNSEFLVKGSIPTRYIDKIYFRDLADMNLANILCENELEIIKKFCYDRSKFCT
ncbi:MAG: DUF4433 domain-containing protein [Clostridia bacterium]|nr:DUF4433 domain-containing protein [Clostridia bacterium]